MFDRALDWLNHNWLQLFLVVGGLMLVHAVVKASRNSYSKLNLFDMVMGEDGKMSLTKTAQLGSFLISTWAFVYLVVHTQLTEWYYTSYMIAWAGTQVLTYYISRNKVSVSTPDQTVSVQSPPSASVNVTTNPPPENP